MKIREVNEDKKQFIALLLLADEQENMVDRYLEKGTMYVLEDGDVKAECVVTDEGNEILQIKNIAVDPENQGKGYGKALIDFLVSKYADEYSVLQVGTGDSPEDESLEKDGPDAYFSTLPVKAMVENVRAHGLPCSVSYSAGTYVCNSVMYRVLHLAARSYPNMKAGFIHVPYSSEQVANKDRPLASMPIEIIAKSLEHAIEAVVKE